jgi:hypothetical protein
LDDVRGHALPHKEQADDFLHADEQERRGQWIHECQKMTQNAINLASQATRALTIGDWSRQDCEEFLDDLEKEFKKVNKELDTYPLVDCEPGVKRKMADCRLRLEAARYEAERVVTRLLRDHDAWGQVSREGRPKEKVPETRAEFRSRRDEGEPLEKALPVRFENLRLEGNGASAGGPEEERSRSSRGVQEERPATSTPVGSDREQRRKRSPEGVSGIRDSHLPPPAPRREASPGRSSARRMYPSPTESSEDEYDSYPRRSRGRKMEGRSCSPRSRKLDERHHREEWDRRREVSPRDREPPGLRRAVPLRPAGPGHHQERRRTRTRRGT